MNFQNASNIEATNRSLLTLAQCKRWAITIAALVICSIPTSNAFGYSYYSDEWVDDSDPTNIRIVGCGVTHDSTNGYMGTPQGYQQIHSYWVKYYANESKWSHNYPELNAELVVRKCRDKLDGAGR